MFSAIVVFKEAANNRPVDDTLLQKIEVSSFRPDEHERPRGGVIVSGEQKTVTSRSEGSSILVAADGSEFKVNISIQAVSALDQSLDSVNGYKEYKGLPVNLSFNFYCRAIQELFEKHSDDHNRDKVDCRYFSKAMAKKKLLGYSRLWNKTLSVL